MRKVYQAFRIFVLSALACQRFGPPRPVAAAVDLLKNLGRQAAQGKSADR
jgi:hypothetical protein